MNRRSLMAAIGLAPVVANSNVASTSIPLEDYPAPPTPALASGPSSHEIMRMAYKAGLFPEAMMRRAVVEEHGSAWRSSAHEKTIEGYRSFSAATKYRLTQEAREEQAWQRFWSDDSSKSYYGLAETARKLMGIN